MKSLQLIAVLVVGFFLVGCVQSIQPFVKDSQLTYDASLVGTWADKEGTTVVVTGDEAARSYSATMTEQDGKVGRYVLHLGKVQDRLLFDVAPADLDLDHAADVYKGYFVATHSFLILDKTAAGLNLRSMDADWFGKFLKEHPDAIAHVTQGEDRIILTADTDKLQEFVLKHLDTDGAYGQPSELKRIEPAATTKP